MKRSRSANSISNIYDDIENNNNNNNKNYDITAILNIINNINIETEINDDEYDETSKKLMDIEEYKISVNERNVDIFDFKSLSQALEDTLLPENINSNNTITYSINKTSKEAKNIFNRITKSKIKNTNSFKYDGYIKINLCFDLNDKSLFNEEFINGKTLKIPLNKFFNKKDLVKDGKNIDNYNLDNILIYEALINNIKSDLEIPLLIGSSIQETIENHVNIMVDLENGINISEIGKDFSYQYSDTDSDSDSDNIIENNNENKNNFPTLEGTDLKKKTNDDVKFFLLIKPNDKKILGKTIIFRKPIKLSSRDHVDVFGGINEEHISNGAFEMNDYVYIPEHLALSHFYKVNYFNLSSRPFVNFNKLKDKEPKILRMKNQLFDIIKTSMFNKMVKFIPYDNINKSYIYLRLPNDFKKYKNNDLKGKIQFELCLSYSIWEKNNKNATAIYYNTIGNYYDNLYIKRGQKIHVINVNDLEKEISYLKDNEESKNELEFKEKNNKRRKKRKNKKK
jgi:hypothetical protein